MNKYGGFEIVYITPAGARWAATDSAEKAADIKNWWNNFRRMPIFRNASPAC